MKIAFFTNKLTLRGTEVAVFDYAFYNQTLLGNKSIIITHPYEKVQRERDTSLEAYERFSKSFQTFFISKREDIDFIIRNEKVDVLYMIKGGGWRDEIYTKEGACTNLCHFVFASRYSVPESERWHTKFAAISPLVASRYGNEISSSPLVLPHIVTVENDTANLRTELGIPTDAVVFGTYSGSDKNKDYILDTVRSNTNDHVWFIFMNIQPFVNHPRVKFLKGTSDRTVKRRFINTCDAMLYMRELGETFGLACAEFSISGKPVICSREAEDTQHISFLGNSAILHSTRSELEDIINNFPKYREKCDVSSSSYLNFTPEYVMHIFKNLI